MYIRDITTKEKAEMNVETLVTHKIPSLNWEAFQEKIELLNKRADKLGLPPITVNTLGTEKVCPWDSLIPKTYYVISVEGSTPHYNGWRFLATLQHTPGGNIVRGIPGFPVPENYRNADANCDHCKLARNRKDTYLLQYDPELLKLNEPGTTLANHFKFMPNPQKSDIIQVGKQCLKDFIPSATVEKLLAQATVVLDFNDLIFSAKDEDEFTQGSGVWGVDALTFLAYTAEAITRFGWVSKTASIQKQLESTSSMAENQINLHMVGKAARTRYGAIDEDANWKPSNQSMKTAKNALAWCRDVLAVKEPKTDYEHNLVVACAIDVAQPRSLGLIASLISTYTRANAPEGSNDKGFWGSVGDKLAGTTLTVESVKAIAMGFDMTKHLHRLRNPEGKLIIWWASAKPWEAGCTYKVVEGRVQRQELYSGESQTVVTRLRGTKI